MIEHVWSVLCERISTDRDSNAVSFLTCIDRLQVEKFPAAVPYAAVGTLWFKWSEEPEPLLLRFSLERPNGELQVLHEGQVEVANRRQRVNLGFSGLPINEVGIHFFRVERSEEPGIWDAVSRMPIEVVQEPSGKEDTGGRAGKGVAAKRTRPAGVSAKGS